MRSTMTASIFFYSCFLVAGATATMPYVGTSEDGSSLVVNSSLTGDVFINGMPVRGLVTVSSVFTCTTILQEESIEVVGK